MSTASQPQLAVDVRELLQAPAAHRHVHLSRQLDDARTDVAAVDPDVPVTVDAEIENVMDGLLVTGHVEATIRTECVRCLTDVTQRLDVEVRELFARTPADADASEPGYAVLGGAILPLDTMVRDALVLAFPPAPRCRPDCAGLCPQCGADRNVATCDHHAPTDPRWLPLAGLRSLTDTQEEGQDARPEA
jgi:uncharacterized protein